MRNMKQNKHNAMCHHHNEGALMRLKSVMCKGLFTHTTTTTTTVVGGCFPGIIFGRSRGIKSIDDNHNHMYLWFKIEGGCDGLWYTFLKL